MLPTIIKVRRQLALNSLRKDDELIDLNNYSDDDVELIYDLYSELKGEELEDLIQKISDSDIEEEAADEFVLILNHLMESVTNADRLISRRLSSVSYSIPDYLISNRQDEDDAVRWALYGLSDEFIINELWRRLVR